MKVLVIGAAGKTGLDCVRLAVQAGHDVTAFVHGHDEKKETMLEGVEVIHGDVQNPSRLETAMTGCEAVLDALGGHSPWKDTGMEANAAKVVLEVMGRVGAKRLVVISVLGVGESKGEAGFFYEHLLIPTFLRGAMKDKGQMEEEIKTSGVEFVIVRPPMLTDGDATGRVRVVDQGETAGKITREDLAAFLVEQLESDEFVGQAVVVEND